MILLLGANGSIGRRYQAVLKALGEPYCAVDIGTQEPDWNLVTKAIIATPTGLHFEHCEEMIERGLPFLCEKPLDKNPFSSYILQSSAKACDVSGFIVNNYRFATLGVNGDENLIAYDFYNTGKDGLIWDVCQLVYLAHLERCELRVYRESFTWNLSYKGHAIRYRAIEYSYFDMVKAFINEQWGDLWTLQDAHEMTRICADMMRSPGGKDCENFMWNSSTNQFNATARQDL